MPKGWPRAGAAVVVADIDEDNAREVAEAITAAGGPAEATVVDVSSPSRPGHGRPAAEHFGGIDFLVNNAAIFGGMKLDFLITVDWEYLERFLAVNLTGALVCTRACYPSMAERGGGAIVNQSSTAAYLYAGYYGWAKAGVNSLTQQLAHELGGMKIRVNAIAPGPTETEAARTVVPESYMSKTHRFVGPEAAGSARRPGGDVPVPPLRRRPVDHRAHLQCRRGPGDAALNRRGDGGLSGEPRIILRSRTLRSERLPGERRCARPRR